MTIKESEIRETEMHFNNGYFLKEDQIKVIRDFHHKNDPPYYVTKLAKKFGIKHITFKKMPIIISGCIKKKKKGEYEILLNEDERITRQRFTAAHELAHFLLHKKDIGDGIRDDALYRSKLASYKESQANKLASDILMPYDKIYALLERGVRLNELPEIFQVSNRTMCIRLTISEQALLAI